MKKAIIRPKGQYDRGTYTIENAGKWNGTIYDFQKNAIIKDLKANGYSVFEVDWECPKGTLEFKEILKKK